MVQKDKVDMANYSIGIQTGSDAGGDSTRSLTTPHKTLQRCGSDRSVRHGQRSISPSQAGSIPAGTASPGTLEMAWRAPVMSAIALKVVVGVFTCSVGY